MNDKNNIPQHIAIIMDGNGRWAKERGFPRSVGHQQGIQRVREIVKSCGRLGIKVLTLFAFSAENWSRPKKEIELLMRALGHFLKREVPELIKGNVRLKFVGRDEPLPKALQVKMQEAELSTQGNTGLILVLALNYGSRQEIVDAVKRCANDALHKRIDLDDIDEESFSRYLYTAGIPDPDLLIRTSGELRISNFLLWQLSYAELYFPKKYWPDFKERDLEEAIKEYQKRQRRFGGIDAG